MLYIVNRKASAREEEYCNGIRALNKQKNKPKTKPVVTTTLY